MYLTLKRESDAVVANPFSDAFDKIFLKFIVRHHRFLAMFKQELKRVT